MKLKKMFPLWFYIGVAITFSFSYYFLTKLPFPPEAQYSLSESFLAGIIFVVTIFAVHLLLSHISKK